MRLFKFIPVTEPTLLENGQPIDFLKSALWVERYRDPGEFQLTALLSSGIKELLPIGTMISHDGTYEVMIVESHHISEDQESDPIITVSGRSFETFLENRVVGIDESVASSTISDYILTSDKTWHQAVSLINKHIKTSADSNNNLPNVEAITPLGAAAGVTEERTVERTDVHQAVLPVLTVEDLGIRTFRQNSFGVVGSSSFTQMYVHRGVDKSATVMFSWKSGDLEGAEYLWTDKKKRTNALIIGRYVSTQVYDLFALKYNRRWMIVDGRDIDGTYSSIPTGGTLTAVINKMQVRGRQALAAQRTINVVRSDVSPTNQFRYRKDYDIGDLVSVTGNYGEVGKMRVIEHVEFMDENGESGYPTLALPGV